MIRLLNDFTLTRIYIFYLDHKIGFQLRRWLGGQDSVIPYLGQQALYPDPVEPPSRAFEWRIQS